jgi:hypothetical protein
MAYQYPYDYEEKAYTPPKLKTNRNMWKLMILNILTLGVYSVYFFLPIPDTLDKVAPKKDRTKTLSFIAAFILSYLTGNIVIAIWHYQIAQRIEEALEERDIKYDFTTNDYWGWYFFGGLIVFAPFLSFVYFHKLCKAMNLLCENYNEEIDQKK